MAKAQQQHTNGKSGNSAVEAWVKAPLAEAQKRLQGLEAEAEKALKELAARGEKGRQELGALGEKGRQELEALWAKLQAGQSELLAHPRVKELGEKATQARDEVYKALDVLQARVVQAVGVASQTQVKELGRELSRLSRKVDALLNPAKKKADKGGSPRA